MWYDNVARMKRASEVAIRSGQPVAGPTAAEMHVYGYEPIIVLSVRTQEYIIIMRKDNYKGYGVTVSKCYIFVQQKIKSLLRTTGLCMLFVCV